MRVRGHLNVDGTDTNRVRFESAGAGSDDWYGIVIDTGGTAFIKYPDFSDAYVAIYDMRPDSTGTDSSSIENCVITVCSPLGIKAKNSGLVIAGTVISGVDPGYGIYIDACEPVLKDDSVRTCETGVYLGKTKMTLRTCAIEGPGDVGVEIWDKAGAGPDSSTGFTDLSITGSFTRHLWTAAGANVEVDSCDFVSPTDSTPSPYGIVANLTSDFKLRSTEIRDYDATGIHLSICVTNDWDLGRDTTGEWGNNSIYTDDSTAYAFDGLGGDTILAERNDWGTDSVYAELLYPDTSYTEDWVVDFDPYHTEDPQARLATGDGQPEIPATFRLYHNYPNPFNASTVIKFDVPKASNVRIDIYNILGQRVKRLTDLPYAAGNYTIEWDGTNVAGKGVATGIYLYRIVAHNFVECKKMLLLK